MFKDRLQKNEFVQKFIDRMVKQIIWFEYGSQIWFVCGFAIVFEIHISTPQKCDYPWSFEQQAWK